MSSSRSSCPRCCSSPIVSGRLQVQDRRTFALEQRALVGRRQESRTPVLRAADHARLSSVRTTNVGRFSLAVPKPVGHPRAQRRPAGEDRAGVHLAHRADVIQPVGPAGADHVDVVDVLRDVRIPVRDPHAALAVLLPGALGRHQRVARRAHRGDGLPNDSGIGLPAQLVELGLGVEQVEWLGPPSMNRKMTDFAVGAWCGVFGASGFATPAASRAIASRSACRAARCAQAAAGSRQESSPRRLHGDSVPVHEFIGVQQHLAEDPPTPRRTPASRRLPVGCRQRELLALRRALRSALLACREET